MLKRGIVLVQDGMRLRQGGSVGAHLEVGCLGSGVRTLGAAGPCGILRLFVLPTAVPMGPTPAFSKPQCSAWPGDPQLQLDPLTAQGKPAGGCMKPGLLIAWNFEGGAEDGVTGSAHYPGALAAAASRGRRSPGFY